MASPAHLIPTKFAPPRISTRSIIREQLIHRLHQVRHCSLVLVTGGAGFGKTTLLAQWRKELVKSGAGVSWLSLVQEDGQYEQFCANLVGSLREAGVPVGDHLLLLLTADESGSMQATAAALVNALAKGPRALYVMIDDFHHVDDRRALNLVQTLIERGPVNTHFVVSSRVVPGLLLGRLRAGGQVGEIECAELSALRENRMSFLKANLNDAIDVDSAHLTRSRTHRGRRWPREQTPILKRSQLRAPPGSGGWRAPSGG